MKDLTRDEQMESMVKAFLNIDANILINKYTNENVIFGRIKAHDKVPIDKYAETNDEDIYHYKYGLYDYIKSIYPLFKEIIMTKITPDFFAIVPDILDDDTKRIYYSKVIKIILAIKLKGLRQGSRIDRYVKDLPLISPLITRLIKQHKGHFYLKNNDINSLDYKLALFSCFRFFNEENAKLFELKVLRWEVLNRQIK